jgi:hypothetical protein
MKHERIAKNAQIPGIEPREVVRVLSADPHCENAVTLVYEADDERLSERVPFRSNESDLSIAPVGRPWSLGADGADFKLATETYLINLAHLLDSTMAVHASNVASLPHKIMFAYESMLPRQPVRYLIVDGPPKGAAAHKRKPAPKTCRGSARTKEHG